MNQKKTIFILLARIACLSTLMSIFFAIASNTDKPFATDLVENFFRLFYLSPFVIYYHYLSELKITLSTDTYRENRRKIAFFMFFFIWVLTTGLLVSESWLKHLDVRWIRFTLGGLCMSIFTVLLVHISVKYFPFGKYKDKQ